MLVLNMNSVVFSDIGEGVSISKGRVYSIIV